MARAAISACHFARRSRRDRARSDRQMLGQSRSFRTAAFRRDRRSASIARGVGRPDRNGRGSARKPTRAFDMACRSSCSIVGKPTSRTSERRRRAQLARLARNGGWPGPVGLGVGRGHWPGVEGAALRDRFPHPGQTEFVAERCGVSPENVVMMLAGPTLRTVPLTTHVPLGEVLGALSIGIHRSARPRRAARASAQLRDRRTAPRRFRAQPARRRRRRARARGNRDHRASDRRARGGRLASDRPPPRRHHVPRPRPRQLRCGFVHVSRPGADPDQGAALRGSGQRDARPADRPHRARSWHGVRHRRPGPRRSARRWRRQSAWPPNARGPARRRA